MTPTAVRRTSNGNRRPTGSRLRGPRVKCRGRAVGQIVVDDAGPPGAERSSGQASPFGRSLARLTARPRRALVAVGPAAATTDEYRCPAAPADLGRGELAAVRRGLAYQLEQLGA